VPHLPRAQAVDPEIVVIAGALAQTISLDGRDLSDLIFLQRMYDAGRVSAST